MRTKAFLMSTGLATSVWLTGCQSASLSKYAAQNTSCTSCVVKVTPDGKDSLHGDLLHLADEKAEKAVRVTSLPNKIIPAAPAATNTTCAAQTGSVVIREPVTYTLPGAPTAAPASPAPPTNTVANAAPVPTQRILTQLPNNESPLPVAASPPSVPLVSAAAAPTEVAASAPLQAPAAAGYGPGVEIVDNLPSDTLPPPTAERAATKNVPTARVGQANNYQVVVGQVYQFRRAWKLRYATVDSDDKYGGSFTLVGDSLGNLKDGQLVRVEGSVLPSDDRVSGARYQVSRVEVVESDSK